MTTRNYKTMPVPSHVDERGSLLFMQEDGPVPFRPRRVFVIKDVQEGSARGGHAHREQEQFLVMLAGSVRIMVDDGHDRMYLRLDNSQSGLYAPSLHWLELDQFSDGAICMVLASGNYDEQEYIRDYAEFDRLKTTRRQNIKSDAG